MKEHLVLELILVVLTRSVWEHLMDNLLGLVLFLREHGRISVLVPIQTLLQIHCNACYLLRLNVLGTFRMLHLQGDRLDLLRSV
jgi:hypothetical protein